MKNHKDNKFIQPLAPIFIQLREIIRNFIEDGEFLPGTAIPSENELSDIYKVNRVTVRNAVDALVQEGILRRVQGKGVYVVGKKFEQQLVNDEGFLLSHDKQNVSTKVFEKVKMIRVAGDKFAELFDIKNDDLIFYIQRVISIDQNPIVVEDVYIPQYVLPELNNIDSSVFKFDDIFSFYNVKLAGQKQRIEIIDGNDKIRKTLKMPNNAAIFMMESWYKNQIGQEVMYSKQYINSNQSSFTINL